MLRPNPIRFPRAGTRSFCEEVATAYDRAPEYDESQTWRWELLRKSIERWYKIVQSKVRVEFVEGQPYNSAEQMRDEVRRTGVLKISTDFNEHPYFTPTENLKFRAVHDMIVHIAPGDDGPSFGERGEVRAYNLHRMLAPKEAWPALFTKVLAQACYFNARGDFPEQKLAVLPFDYYNVGRSAK